MYQSGRGEGADLLTLGGAADHDDGDDALLGAGHGWLLPVRARRLGGGRRAAGGVAEF
jgi:hypothetical protein